MSSTPTMRRRHPGVVDGMADMHRVHARLWSLVGLLTVGLAGCGTPVVDGGAGVASTAPVAVTAAEARWIPAILNADVGSVQLCAPASSTRATRHGRVGNARGGMVHDGCARRPADVSRARAWSGRPWPSELERSRAAVGVQ